MLPYGGDDKLFDQPIDFTQDRAIEEGNRAIVMEEGLPQDKGPQDQRLKVTDKRIFTAEGEIKDEYRNKVTPLDPATAATARPPDPPKEPPAVPSEPPLGDRGKKMRDRAANPGTPFTNFVESLIAQAYMSLGMLRNPYQAEGAVDFTAARQMIDIVAIMQDKTKGNLTEDESDFLAAHLGELKLAYLQLSKARP